MSQPYKLLGAPGLGGLIDDMIEMRLAIDLAGTHMQTHASLTRM